VFCFHVGEIVVSFSHSLALLGSIRRRKPNAPVDLRSEWSSSQGKTKGNHTRTAHIGKMETQKPAPNLNPEFLEPPKKGRYQSRIPSSLLTGEVVTCDIHSFTKYRIEHDARPTEPKDNTILSNLYSMIGREEKHMDTQ
jgi:hypothetical protein